MKAYLIYGVLVCSLFTWAGARGFAVTSLLHPAHWSPQGHGGHK